jgi:hypothetical protein
MGHLVTVFGKDGCHYQDELKGCHALMKELKNSLDLSLEQWPLLSYMKLEWVA